MKKLFLLLGGAVAALNASAQYNSSLMLGTTANSAKASYVESHGNKGANFRELMYNRLNASHAAQKTTTTYHGAWFSFQIANDDGSSLVTAGFNTVYPDSNLLVTTGTPPFYWWCMGTGTSFDPESKFFKTADWKNTTVAAPFGGSGIDTTTGYFVDSVVVVGLYAQIDATQVDTLHIDICYADTGTNAWKVNYKTAQVATLGITALPDTTYRVANAWYDSSKNEIGSAVAGVQRIIKKLDAAAAVDTDASGLNVWVFPLPTPMWVPKHKKVVALTHFASSVAHPLGTDISTANRWISYTWDFNSPLQAVNDYNSGLVVTNAERHSTADKWTFQGKCIMVPSYVYTAPLVIHNPFYMFYLRQATTGGVSEVANHNTINAYPNPANNQLTVSFDIAGANNATVTLVNAIGQKVASKTVNNGAGNVAFNTAALPAGVYFYTVEANGQQSTGRVSIAH